MPQKIYAAAHHVTIMRTLAQNGGVGGYSDRKPSKLEQMRADYQKKLMREKEEKMVNMYEENQRKAMMRLTRNGSGGAGDQYSNGAGSPTGGKSVREFFNERRRLEAAGGPMPAIDQHYKQAKGYASPGGWSSRTGSGNSTTKGSHLMHPRGGSGKNSAGRDRAQPLAPIQHRPPMNAETATTAGNNNNVYGHPNQDNRFAPPGGGQARSGIPLRQHNPQSAGGGGGEDNPFYGRPTLIKHKPLPPTTNADRAAQGKPPAQPSSLPRYVPHQRREQQQQQQQQQQPQQRQQQQVNRQPQYQQQQQQQQQQQRQPHPPPGDRQQPGIPRAIRKPQTFGASSKATPVSNGVASNNVGQHNGGGSGRGGGAGRGKGAEKLTDFQKWQLEQEQARESRLKKFNSTQPNDALGDGTWSPPNGDASPDNRDYGNTFANNAENKENGGGYRPVINGRAAANKDRLSRLNGHRHTMAEDEAEEEDEDDADDGGEDDIPEEDEEEAEQNDYIQEQERLLLEQIAAKQRDVERLRKEREQEEEEEKREMMLRKKREAADRARQKKLEEERRKEEERQRKQEEEDERQERKREEQRQKEDEKRRKEEEKRWKEEERRHQEEEKRAAKRQAEEDRRLAKQQQQQKQQSSARKAAAASSDYRGYDYDQSSPAPPSSSSRQPNPHDTFRATSEASVAVEEKPVAAAGSDARFYAQAAASSDARGSVGSLVPCRQCGRKFAQDRIKKHQDACKTANKPRKEFNAALKRVEGTELAKYAGKNRKPDPPKKKSNWRAQHEQFIESLRYAKKVTEYEKEGKDLRDLAPPPPTQQPDLVPCPHCGRTFNETAAERHIPRCQSAKTRPPPMNTRRR